GEDDDLEGDVGGGRAGAGLLEEGGLLPRSVRRAGFERLAVGGVGARAVGGRRRAGGVGHLAVAGGAGGAGEREEECGEEGGRGGAHGDLPEREDGHVGTESTPGGPQGSTRITSLGHLDGAALPVSQLNASCRGGCRRSSARRSCTGSAPSPSPCASRP